MFNIGTKSDKPEKLEPPQCERCGCREHMGEAKFAPDLGQILCGWCWVHLPPGNRRAKPGDRPR